MNIFTTEHFDSHILCEGDNSVCDLIELEYPFVLPSYTNAYTIDYNTCVVLKYGLFQM